MRYTRFARRDLNLMFRAFNSRNIRQQQPASRPIRIFHYYAIHLRIEFFK